MRHPQIVIYESDGFLASQIEGLARENRWVVRESRHADVCLSFLQQASPVVLLIKLGPKPLDDLSLLDGVRERIPDCPALVFGDVKFEGAEQRAAIAGLAYDLGARYVMFSPLTRALIEDLVAGLMAATIRRSVPDTEERADA